VKTLRPLAYIALVAMLFVAGDRLLAALLERAVDGSEFRYSRLYRGNLNYDVLAIGDSRAVHSIYAPALSQRLCRSVLNLAYNGMSTEIAEAVLRDYLERNAPPKAVLIEVSSVTRRNDLLNDIRLYAGEPDHVAALLRRDDPWTATWMGLSHLYAFNNEMTLRALYYHGRSDQDWVMSGDVRMTPEVVAKLNPANYPPPRSRAGNVAALKRMVEELAERHIRPILFIAPYHPAYRRLAPSFAAWERQLQDEIGPANKIVDLSQALPANDDFADVQHVNFNGSQHMVDLVAKGLAPAMPVQTVSQCPAPTLPTATLAGASD
jgi:hypothetical protein